MKIEANIPEGEHCNGCDFCLESWGWHCAKLGTQLSTTFVTGKSELTIMLLIYKDSNCPSLKEKHKDGR